MNLLSGLEKFGLGKIDTEHLFEEGKTEEKKEAEQKAEQPQAPVKQEEVHTEEEFLLDKSIRCPVCDTVFKSRMVKTGRVKRLTPDDDLRPRFQYIDTNKYDVSSCPRCGYTAMNRYFPHLTQGQIKMIEEGVRNQFKPTTVKTDEPERSYTYEQAIERYKLALYNTMVKKGKNSEKAYECLKLSWLYRGQIEELMKEETPDKDKIEACRKEEQVYYEQAYEGFIKAIASENFPMCGMEESTVNLLMANMAFNLGKYDVSSKLVSSILVSRVAPRPAKDRAMDLKEAIIKKLHTKNV